jgi:hypothetical protein
MRAQFSSGAPSSSVALRPGCAPVQPSTVAARSGAAALPGIGANAKRQPPPPASSALHKPVRKAPRTEIAAAAAVAAEQGIAKTRPGVLHPVQPAAQPQHAPQPGAGSAASAGMAAGAKGPYTCAKCRHERGTGKTADAPRAALCGHIVCGVCWATARLKGGMHGARPRCPVCNAPQKAARGDL